MMKECGIDKPISAHCARHGFATMALTNGMPIESVSRVLGHTNIVTTQIYARITLFMTFLNNLVCFHIVFIIVGFHPTFSCQGND